MGEYKINSEELINELINIVHELYARNEAGNLVVEHLSDKTWYELCDIGSDYFIQLKTVED